MDLSRSAYAGTTGSLRKTDDEAEKRVRRGRGQLQRGGGGGGGRAVRVKSASPKKREGRKELDPRMKTKNSPRSKKKRRALKEGSLGVGLR